MKGWRRLFAPKNSLIFVQDRLGERTALEKELRETQKYYQFVSLSVLVKAHQAGTPHGYASFCVPQARKRLTREIRPFLSELGIPVTVFVDPERLGTNRLPVQDELRILGTYFPEKKNLCDDLSSRYWNAPLDVERELENVRMEIGPLPLDKLDPLEFLCTWGELLQIGPMAELGIRLSFSPAVRDAWRPSIDFFQQQTHAPILHAYSEFAAISHEKVLRLLGISAVVGPSFGPVLRESPAMNLPQWGPRGQNFTI